MKVIGLTEAGITIVILLNCRGENQVVGSVDKMVAITFRKMCQLARLVYPRNGDTPHITTRNQSSKNASTQGFLAGNVGFTYHHIFYAVTADHILKPSEHVGALDVTK